MKKLFSHSARKTTEDIFDALNKEAKNSITRAELQVKYSDGVIFFLTILVIYAIVVDRFRALLQTKRHSFENTTYVRVCYSH